MKQINKLSKSELLNLIYHNLPFTIYTEHPCECACCGTHPSDQMVEIDSKYLPSLMTSPYYYVCDSCDKDLE